MSAIRILTTGLPIVAALFLGLVSELRAHPFHTTTAEMEYNAQSGRFEITLKVPAADLEQALTRQAALRRESGRAIGGSKDVQPAGSSKRVMLDETPQVHHLIEAYLKAHFFLTSPPDDTSEPLDASPDAAASVTAIADLPKNNGGQRPSVMTVDEKRAQAQAAESNVTARRSELHWLGMELDKSSVWLYFELEPPPADRLSLVNALFFELNAQQINTCTLRTPATKFSLRTDANQPQVALPPQAPHR